MVADEDGFVLWFGRGMEEKEIMCGVSVFLDGGGRKEEAANRLQSRRGPLARATCQNE